MIKETFIEEESESKPLKWTTECLIYIAVIVFSIVAFCLLSTWLTPEYHYANGMTLVMMGLCIVEVIVSIGLIINTVKEKNKLATKAEH